MRATVLSCAVHTCRVRSTWILTWPLNIFQVRRNTSLGTCHLHGAVIEGELVRGLLRALSAWYLQVTYPHAASLAFRRRSWRVYLRSGNLQNPRPAQSGGMIFQRYDEQLSGIRGIVALGDKKASMVDWRLFSFSVSGRARIAPRTVTRCFWRAGACLRRGRIVAWRDASHMPLTGRNTFQHWLVVKYK